MGTHGQVCGINVTGQWSERCSGRRGEGGKIKRMTHIMVRRLSAGGRSGLGTEIADELETLQISTRWGKDRYIIRLRIRSK